MPFSLNLNFFHHPLSPQVLKKKLHQRKFQLEIADWIEKNLRPLGNNAKYLSLCQHESFFTPNTKDIEELYHHLHPYTILGSPGHDLGHHYRDLLSGAAIIASDPTVKKAFQSDQIAAFFSAAYHDIGNGIWPRYQDYFWECGHAEVGAWLFFQLSASYLPEHIRLLTAYAIAAHTHQLKPVETKIGFVRNPWSDDIFYTKNGMPVGVSVWITRFSDRLDTNGNTLFCRHIIANVEGAKQEGRDFSGSSWYEINKKSLSLLMKPDTIIEDNMPSTLKHMQNFANSARTITAYSQHDNKFPTMKKLITYKVEQSDALINIVKTQTGKPNFKKFSRFVAKLSLSPTIKSTLNRVEKLWNDLTPEEKQHWGPAFEFIEETHPEFLKMLKENIDKGTSPLIKAIKPLTDNIFHTIL